MKLNRKVVDGFLWAEVEGESVRKAGLSIGAEKSPEVAEEVVRHVSPANDYGAFLGSTEADYPAPRRGRFFILTNRKKFNTTRVKAVNAAALSPNHPATKAFRNTPV